MKNSTRMIMAMAVLAGLLLVAAATAVEAAPSAAGFVAKIKGRGYIVRGADTIMISGMDLLYPKDTVRLNKGSTARITICGSKGFEIRGEAVFVVRGAGPAFKKGRANRTYAVDKKACLAALDVFSKNETRLPDMVLKERKGTIMLRSKKKRERSGVYVLRGGKKEPAIELFRNRLMPERTFFAWTPVPGRASYLVRVKSGDEPIWTVTLTKNSYEYPQGAPALDSGREYNITIRALSREGAVLARCDDIFSLFTAEEVNSIRKEEESVASVSPEGSPERQVLLGKFAEARGELDMALAFYQKALSLDPGNAGLKERIRLLKTMLEQI